MNNTFVTLSLYFPSASLRDEKLRRLSDANQWVSRTSKNGEIFSLHLSTRDCVDSNDLERHVVVLDKWLSCEPGREIAGNGNKLWIYREMCGANASVVLSNDILNFVRCIEADIVVDVWAEGDE